MPRSGLSLARGVHDLLDRRGVEHVLIGAGALSAYGAVRATVDVESRLSTLPADAAQLWDAIRAGR